jgi:hypothetical protein
MSVETDLAWCAGFFDGEGNIRCRYRAKYGYELQLQISQKDRRVLDRFKRSIKSAGLYGSEIFFGGPYSDNRGYSFYRLYIANSNAIKAFEAMKPYLDEAKLEQAEEAINKWKEGHGYIRAVK